MQVISRELYEGLVKIIVGTINSPLHVMTQKEKEAYLNNAWKLTKEYDRKVTIREQEDLCWQLKEYLNTTVN